MASKQKTKSGEISIDLLKGRQCYVLLDKSKMSKIVETDSEVSGSENSEWEEEEKKLGMDKKRSERAKKTTSKGRKATKQIETDNGASESENSMNIDKAKKILSKRSKVFKRIQIDSEGSGNSESETEKMKSKILSKRKKATKKLETDSENESLDSENSGKKLKRGLDKKVFYEENMKARPVACKVCKKEFKLYAALVRHQNVHKTLKHKCVLCGDCFEYRTAYGNHMKKEHSEVDMFPCGYPACEESYKTQKKLRDHEKSHLKHMCRFCKRGFARKIAMQKHVKLIHF